MFERSSHIRVEIVKCTKVVGIDEIEVSLGRPEIGQDIGILLTALQRRLEALMFRTKK